MNREAIEWGFYITRGWMVVRLNRRRGGVTGIYHCEIPVLKGPPIVYKNISIGVYTARTGEWYMWQDSCEQTIFMLSTWVFVLQSLIRLMQMLLQHAINFKVCSSLFDVGGIEGISVTM